MKIIGQQGRDRFIVTATDRELVQVAGAQYTSSPDAPRIDVGVEINVQAMYTRLCALKNAEQSLASAQKTLRAVADLLDPIRPMLESANQETSE